jgi:hypothetical protein
MMRALLRICQSGDDLAHARCAQRHLATVA